jgi:hypothetical protein
MKMLERKEFAKELLTFEREKMFIAEHLFKTSTSS